MRERKRAKKKIIRNNINELAFVIFTKCLRWWHWRLNGKVQFRNANEQLRVMTSKLNSHQFMVDDAFLVNFLFSLYVLFVFIVIIIVVTRWFWCRIFFLFVFFFFPLAIVISKKFSSTIHPVIVHRWSLVNVVILSSVLCL